MKTLNTQNWQTPKHRSLQPGPDLEPAMVTVGQRDTTSVFLREKSAKTNSFKLWAETRSNYGPQKRECIATGGVKYDSHQAPARLWVIYTVYAAPVYKNLLKTDDRSVYYAACEDEDRP